MAVPARPWISVAIGGRMSCAELPEFYDRVAKLLEPSGASAVLCDVSEASADAVTVDALARLQLAARRRGCCVRLRGASDELRDLVGFMGLCSLLDRGPVGQAEEGEAPLRVEEERELDDPAVGDLQDL